MSFSKCIFAVSLASALLASAPAFACSWIHAPEPVGAPAANFIARRMIHAAAFVDIAVPESVAPMLASKDRPFAPQIVTFRVLERIKGNSPDRFTLFATGLKPDGAAEKPTDLRHWVDEAAGTVSPFATPWEAPAAEFSMTSCDPGFIEPAMGRTYVVFREADGSLLGPVEFHAGERPARGFPFVDVGLPTESEWFRAVRLQGHPEVIKRQGAGTPASLPPPIAPDPNRGSVSFKRLLTEGEARAVLQRAGAKPYAVFSRGPALSGVHRVPEAQASLEVVGAARRAAAARPKLGIPAGLVARARHALKGETAESFGNDATKREYGMMLLNSLAQAEADRAGLAADQPTIYGVLFLGGPAVRRALAASSSVEKVQESLLVRGRPAPPEPVYGGAPAPAGRRFRPEIETLAPDEIYRRLKALVDGGPAAPADARSVVTR